MIFKYFSIEIYPKKKIMIYRQFHWISKISKISIISPFFPWKFQHLIWLSSRILHSLGYVVGFCTAISRYKLYFVVQWHSFIISKSKNTPIKFIITPTKPLKRSIAVGDSRVVTCMHTVLLERLTLTRWLEVHPSTLMIYKALGKLKTFSSN